MRFQRHLESQFKSQTNTLRWVLRITTPLADAQALINKEIKAPASEETRILFWSVRGKPMRALPTLQSNRNTKSSIKHAWFLSRCEGYPDSSKGWWAWPLQMRPADDWCHVSTKGEVGITSPHPRFTKSTSPPGPKVINVEVSGELQRLCCWSKSTFHTFCYLAQLLAVISTIRVFMPCISVQRDNTS